MKSSLLLCLALGVMLALTVCGCASYPEEQLKLAQTAMDQAKEQRAESFAAGNWEDAMKAWDEGQEHIKNGKYALAGPALLRAKSRFEKAAEIAAAKRDVVMKELLESQRTFNVRYAALKNDLAATRVSASLRKEMEAAFGQLDQQSEKLITEIDQGDLVKAQATVKEALGNLYQSELKMQAATKKR